MSFRAIPSISNFILIFILLFVATAGVSAQITERGLKLKSSENLEVDEFEDYDQRYAIIVGINKYKDLSIPSLEYATEDAQSIRQLLIEKFRYQPENIKLFLNEEATKANIMSAMYAFQATERNAQMLFYFAGHGETVDLAGGGEMGALLAYDVNPEQILLTGIRMNEIRDVTNVIAAKHQLFLVDACYGGLAAVTTRALDRQTQRYLSNLLASEAKQIITAGGKGETVIEKAEWGHSAFAKVLLDGLTLGTADLDKNGLVTGDELASFMKPRVNRFSDSHQTPVYRKFTPAEGEFVFLMEGAGDEDEGPAEQMLSEVSVRSNPAEADIIVNGEPKGKTPSTISLSYGINNIRILKEGYSEFSRTVEIQNPTFNIFAPLERSVTQVQVTSNAVGAEVYLDGELVGKTPFTGTRTHGLVKLEIRKEGYLPYDEYVLIDNEKATFDIELDQSASLTVKSNPSKADVYLNGEFKGVTPLNLEGLLRAEHTIRLEKENYPPVEEKIDLEDNLNEEVEIRLREYAGAIRLVGMDGSANVTVYGERGVSNKFQSLPATSEKLTFGTYNVEIRKKGFKPVVKEVEVDEPVEQVNVLNDLKPKSKFGSVALSVLVPGGGQFYMGKTGRGALFLIGGAASAAYVVSTIGTLTDKVDTYESAQRSYRNATSNFDQRYQQMEAAYEAKEAAKDDVIMSLGIFMGIRGIELLDNLLFPSPRQKLENAKLKFESGGSTVTMRYNF
ncbi:MAG: PEGA domain-containing protein [Balneolaceae bacterium]|nr:PEGA domain-containing protein [Balneolaceae bacterium]